MKLDIHDFSENNKFNSIELWFDIGAGRFNWLLIYSK